MTLRIGKECIIIPKNPLNQFWNWRGQFQNCPEIFIDGQWYRCGIHFKLKEDCFYAVISDPMIVDKTTSKILKFYKQGDYCEIRISTFKKNLVQYLMNVHDLNTKYNQWRGRIKERRNTILVFSFATILSLLYFEANEMNDDFLMDYIGKENWIQTVFIFLTVSGFISIFYPFTIQKPLDEIEIRKIIEKVQEEERTMEEIRKRATF